MTLTTRLSDALGSVFSKPARSMPEGWVGSAGVGPGSTIFLEPEESNWSASATGYRCVAAISTNAASLALQVRNRDDTTVEGHWLSLLWETPNPQLSRRVLAEIVWGRLETKGQAFVFVDRGQSGTGTPRALHPLFCHVSAVVQGVADPEKADGVRQELLGFLAYVGGKRIPLLPEEVLWLRYPDPNDQWGHLAPLAASGHAIELDAYARAWQHNEFKNGAKPKHVVYLGDVTEAMHNQAVENWRSGVEGAANAGKSLLVSGRTAASVSRITMNPEEMSWLDTRKVGAEEVMLAHGVPRDYLMGGTTYENRAAAKTTLWSDTIVPKLEVVASEMTRQLLVREAGRRARFDTDDVDALQEGADAKAKRTTDLVGMDVLMLDEARAEMGLDGLPGGAGQLTLTAYRTMIAATAQAALLGVVDPNDRTRFLQLPKVNAGRVDPMAPVGPLLLPSGRRVHGPDGPTILAEYDRHERVIIRATARLAKRQQAVVLTNADRLFGGKSKKAQGWLLEVASASAAVMEARTGDDEAALEAADVQLRSKINDLFDRKHWAEESRKEWESPVGGAWHAGGTTMAKSLGLSFDKFDLLVLTAMDNRLDALADQVTDTTRHVLEQRVLLQGVANGESIDQLKARIRSVFADLSSWRATVIARTETVGGFNGATHVIGEASGVVVERRWLSTDDKRTRDSHIKIDGQAVKGFKTRYTNGCLHPGDPTARPEETILCRCVELYETED